METANKKIVFSRKPRKTTVRRSILKAVAETVRKNWTGWNRSGFIGSAFKTAEPETGYLMVCQSGIAKALSKKVISHFGNPLFQTVFDRLITNRLCYHLNLE